MPEIATESPRWDGDGGGRRRIEGARDKGEVVGWVEIEDITVHCGHSNAIHRCPRGFPIILEATSPICGE